MHAVVLRCINQYTKFEVPSFTNYKDMIGPKFRKMVTWLFTPPFRCGLSHSARIWYSLPACKIWDSGFSRSRYIIRSVKIKVGHV